MGGMVQLQPKGSAETRRESFDFISKLAAGETISGTPVVTCTVWSGVDASPSNVVSGTASVSGTKAVQTLTGGIAGVIYKLVCVVVTSLGQTLTLTGYLAVIGDPL